MSGGVAVVGAANLDLVVSLDRFAQPGETVLGRHLEQVAGGKGLNQAVAAARRSPCALIGCLGNDEAGESLVRHLEACGVDTAHLRRVDRPTGRAIIHVTSDGENSIVVVPLANGDMTAELVRTALAAQSPQVVLAQLEVPLAAVQAAARWAQDNEARFILNPSPARDIPPSLLKPSDPLIVNIGEAQALLGGSSTSDPSQLATQLAEAVRSIAVTVGAHGVYVGTAARDLSHIPGLPVSVLDTTGAGDEFAGALAAELATDPDLVRAAQAANRAAASVVALPRSQRQAHTQFTT